MARPTTSQSNQIVQLHADLVTLEAALIARGAHDEAGALKRARRELELPHLTGVLGQDPDVAGTTQKTIR